jgi:hypothetical protein
MVLEPNDQGSAGTFWEARQEGVGLHGSMGFASYLRRDVLATNRLHDWVVGRQWLESPILQGVLHECAGLSPQLQRRIQGDASEGFAIGVLVQYVL